MLTKIGMLISDVEGIGLPSLDNARLEGIGFICDADAAWAHHSFAALLSCSLVAKRTSIPLDRASHA